MGWPAGEQVGTKNGIIGLNVGWPDGIPSGWSVGCPDGSLDGFEIGPPLGSEDGC